MDLRLPELHIMWRRLFLFWQKKHIDVIFTDIRMPGKSGIEFLQILQRDYPEVRSVILSGYADFTYAQDAIRYGAMEYLTKPVVLKDVEALLERLFQEFSKHKQEEQIHQERLEALLISAAHGHSELNDEKYDLPVCAQWYGLAMALYNRNLSEDEIHKKKKRDVLPDYLSGTECDLSGR